MIEESIHVQIACEEELQRYWAIVVCIPRKGELMQIYGPLPYERERDLVRVVEVEHIAGSKHGNVIVHVEHSDGVRI